MPTNSLKSLQASVLLVFVAMLFISGCQVEQLENAKSFRHNNFTIIEATYELPDVDTKTVRDDKAKIYWTPGDAISLFYGSGSDGGSKFVAQNEAVSLKTTFAGYILAVTGGSDIDEDENYFWGLYPYDKTASCDGRTVTMSIPSVQPGMEGTFAPGMAPSLGRSTRLTLSFRNIWSGFGFTVSEPGFQSLTFKGNNNEDLAGRAKIGIDDNGLPYVVEILEGVKEVTLTAPTSAGFVPGVYYYMQFFPGTLSSGFTVTISSATKIGTWVYEESMEYPRSTWKRAAEVDKREGIVWQEKTNYSVGDIVDSDGIGIVVWISDNKDSLLLMSVDELQNRNWNNSYSWCEAYGNSWKMPSIEELSLISLNFNQLNSCLKSAGYVELSSLNQCYWSSTINPSNANYYYRERLYDGTIFTNTGNDEKVSSTANYCRAVKICGFLDDNDDDDDDTSIIPAQITQIVLKVERTWVKRGGYWTNLLIPFTFDITDYSEFYELLDQDGERAMFRLTLSFNEPVTQIMRIKESITDNSQYPRYYSIHYIQLPASIATIGADLLTGYDVEFVDLHLCTGLETIGSSAFNTHISHLNLPSFSKLRQIGANAFSGASIKVFDLSSNSYPVSIKRGAFKNSSLRDFRTAGCGIKLIEADAFYGTNIEILDLSNSADVLEEIGDNAFCKSPLSTIIINSPIKKLYHIGNGAFQDTKLEYINWSFFSNISTIGNHAFDRTPLQALDMSPCTRLKTIGSYAFSNCNFEELDLSNNQELTTILDGAFAGTPIKTCILPPNLVGISNLMLAGTAIKYLDLSQYKTWTEIGDEAFKNTSITTLLLPDAPIKRIGSNAFFNASITQLDLSNYTELETLASEAFAYSRKLTSICLPSSIKVIGSNAFANSGVKVLDLSQCNNLSTIPYKCFYESSIKTLHLPKSLKTIEQEAFCYSSLSTVTIPKESKLEYIGKYAFTSSAISVMDLSNAYALSKIESKAFLNCYSLKTLKLSDGVKSLGAGLLGNCTSLINFYVKATVPPTFSSLGTITSSTTALGTIPSTTKIYVPEESWDSYRKAEGWMDYSTHIVKYKYE